MPRRLSKGGRWWNTIHCTDLWKGVLSVSGRKQVVCGSKGKQELNGLKAKENSIKDKKTDCRKTYITKRVGGSPPAPCKNSKKWPEPLFRHALLCNGLLQHTIQFGKLVRDIIFYRNCCIFEFTGLFHQRAGGFCRFVYNGIHINGEKTFLSR